ncbi:MAG: glycosyl transferase [Planctomycetota bacterium]|nr:MAG: glycosyl transferase [Planctomycetota bacterium]
MAGAEGRRQPARRRGLAVSGPNTPAGERRPPAVALVIPLYDEERIVAALLERLERLLPMLAVPAEVVVVDDGSTDGTPALLEAAAATRPWLRVVVLSRNFGHQAALTAGMHHTRGEVVALMDGDLQDPPEVVVQMLQRLAEGFDVVYAVRRERKEHTLKRLCYAAYYRLLRRLAGVTIPLDSGDFCVLRRRVVDAMNALPERRRFLRGLRSWVGFRQVGFPYARAARAGGRSKYTFGKLVRLALDGIFGFSEAPLRWAAYAGAAIALGGCAWGGWLLGERLLVSEGAEVAGWAPLGAVVAVLAGVQLLAVGLLGEYVARIHDEVRGRPPYVVDRLIGFEQAQAAARRREASRRLSGREERPVPTGGAGA